MNIDELINQLKSNDETKASGPVIISNIKIERAEGSDVYTMQGYVAARNANVTIYDQDIADRVKAIGRPGNKTRETYGDVTYNKIDVLGVIIEAEVSPVREVMQKNGNKRRVCTIEKVVDIRKSGFVIAKDDPFAV